MDYIRETKIIAGTYSLTTPVGTYRLEKHGREWRTYIGSCGGTCSDVHATKKESVAAIHGHVLATMSEALTINASMGTTAVPIQQKGNPLQVDNSIPVHRDSVAMLIALLSVHEWMQQGKRSMVYGTEYVPTATHSGIGQRITMSPPMSAKGNGPRQYAFRMWIESYADRSAIQVAKESKAIHSEVTAFKDESSPQSCWPMKEWAQDWDAKYRHEFNAPSDKRQRKDSVLWCRKCGFIPNKVNQSFNSNATRRERIKQQGCAHDVEEYVMDHGADVGTTTIDHKVGVPMGGKVIKTFSLSDKFTPTMETDRERLVRKLTVRNQKVVSDFDATPQLPDMDMIGIGRQLIGSGKRRVRVSLARADQGKVIKGRLTAYGHHWFLMNGTTFPVYKVATGGYIGERGQSNTPEFRLWWNETVNKLAENVGVDPMDSWKYRFSTEFHSNQIHRQSMAQFFQPIDGPRPGEIAPHALMVHWQTNADGSLKLYNSDGSTPKAKGNGSGGKVRRRRTAKQIKADTKAKVTEIPEAKDVRTDLDALNNSPVASKLREFAKPTKRKPMGSKVVADAVAFDARKMLERGTIG